MSRYSINKLPEDVLMELAHKVTQLRKSAGMSRQNLAERSGVSYGSIRRFEATGQISLESLLKIAHVLERLSDFDLLLNEKDEQNVDHLFSV